MYGEVTSVFTASLSVEQQRGIGDDAVKIVLPISHTNPSHPMITRTFFVSLYRVIQKEPLDVLSTGKRTASGGRAKKAARGRRTDYCRCGLDVWDYGGDAVYELTGSVATNFWCASWCKVLWRMECGDDVHRLRRF
jgi:hypothetical protein